MKYDRCYVIAEAGLNHNGSLEMAKKLIDVAVIAEADAVKFQKRNVETLAIKDVLDAPDHRFPAMGTTYREVRDYLEFNKEEYEELTRYANERDIEFLCTAFDIESADFLFDIGIKEIKIASHSLTNLPLLNHINRNAEAVILSTGMCTFDEIDQAVEVFSGTGNAKLMLMHCVSAYPHSTEDSHLGMISQLRN
ncbi:MAG: N-acetylneuraminate synthase family protein, partial [Bacteroidales bacterium]|nr:N-acetylneuraminate synthase family protein [Bacteroidales bacterium]